MTGDARQIDLGAGDDTVKVSGDGVTQVRLTFTSADVGSGNPRDGNNAGNEDGGLAVRLQAENNAGGLTGSISRFDDEGITFVGKGGLTFDVRDLPTGTQRGDQFDEVKLGTQRGDKFDEKGSAENYYINAGMGEDVIKTGKGADFLVGGADRDVLDGREGRDTQIGGGGNDDFVFSTKLNATSNVDRILDFDAAGDDRILLDADVFKGLRKGALDQDAFFASANGAAGDAEDRILYNSTSGALSFDADGTGGKAAVQFAILQANGAAATGVAADDFRVVETDRKDDHDRDRDDDRGGVLSAQAEKLLKKILGKDVFNDAEDFFFADVDTLPSNVGGRAIVNGEGKAVLAFDDDTDTLTVAIAAKNMDQGGPHLQHIHGFTSNTTDARSPTLANDTDGDGIVELAEGLPAYGPILLNLSTPGGPNGHFPMADEDGTYFFLETYELPAERLGANPLLTLREIVLHGDTLRAGQGANGGEADGTAGFKILLPVASGEIQSITALKGLDFLKDVVEIMKETDNKVVNGSGMLGHHPDFAHA